MDYIIGQWQHPYTIFVTSPFLLLQAGVNDQRGEVAEVEQAVQLYGPVHLRAEDYHLPGQPKKKGQNKTTKKTDSKQKRQNDQISDFDLTCSPETRGRGADENTGRSGLLSFKTRRDRLIEKKRGKNARGKEITK